MLRNGMLSIVVGLAAAMSCPMIARSAEAPNSCAALEATLLGTWRGGPCCGSLKFSPDGTFERRRYSPGNNEIAGTWSIRWDALPPTLVLTCKTSDDPVAFPVGKVWDFKLLRLDAKLLTYEYPGTEHSRPQPTTYERANEQEADK